MAILALLLASGVRLSEAVNLDLRDVNLNMMIIEVTRKGGKRDSVNVAGFAKPYLEAYMSIRQQRYKAEKRIRPFSCLSTVVCLTASMLLLLKNGGEILCGLQDTCYSTQTSSYASNATLRRHQVTSSGQSSAGPRQYSGH